ncbi:uncharacterized protein LOC129109037 isoform X1 [Anoplopoma fimbria]|uniref:uncharacterized protein LOC129109037 isoform X1 n=1 Tax=Anoplopoma fimbria TaxID=229290 RepID=UPI0023ECF9C4|nr:uncharacterized protein LOC129109037 isoform X1 [Anoplopoma fimbria]
MESSNTGPCVPRGSSSVSLNERFSQVLVDQLTRSRLRTFDPILLQQRKGCVLLMRRERSSLLHIQSRSSSVAVQQRCRRRSVWTRLGWQRLLSTSRPPGFWSFMNKYRWRSSFTSTCRRRGNLHRRLGQPRLLRTRNIQKLRGRTHLQRGRATALRRRGLSKEQVPTKEQLDAQLDDYMSMSRSRLDKQLDEYMSMAGQTHWD